MEISWISILLGGFLGVITGTITYRRFYKKDTPEEKIVVNCSGLIKNKKTDDISTKKLVFYR